VKQIKVEKQIKAITDIVTEATLLI